jgi:hypothetical protein
MAFLFHAGLGSEDQPVSVSEEAVKAYREQLLPILTSKCLTCHNPEKKKGGLDLSRRQLALKGGKSGPALLPGKADASRIYQKLSAGEMPPQSPLGPAQVAAFKTWIDGGAPYEKEPLTVSLPRAGPDWWSLRKITRPVPRHGQPGYENRAFRPDARPESLTDDAKEEQEKAWSDNPIDGFILEKLRQQGLKPSKEADRVTLIRRATFDLIGLPPTPDEIDEFLRDSAPNAYEKLIDRLLASPHYGERWARHWLDVIRFAESHGYETNNLRPNAWPYRDYIIHSFNEDKPYPQFVLEQLAGDTVKEGDWLVRAATGFLVGGSHDVVGNQTVEGQLQQRMDDLDDIITVTGATFLGLTTNCARCHDHKFDPISQRDYYGLQAIFSGVQHADRDVRAPDADSRERRRYQFEKELAQVERQLDDLEPLAATSGKSPRRPPVNPRRNVERFGPATARFVRFTIDATNNQMEPCIDELEVFTADERPRNVALASGGAKATASSTYPNNPSHKLEHLNDGRFGNEQSWISNEPAKGWVQIELPGVFRLQRIVWGRDRNGVYQDRLPTQYKIEVATIPDHWQVVASSQDRISWQSSPAATVAAAGLTLELNGERAAFEKQRDYLRRLITDLSPFMKIYAGTFAQPGPTHVLRRGDPMQKQEEVGPSTLAAVRPRLEIDPKSPESTRRLALARWLTHPDNPLPARVMVNRVWQYHFGQGIVSTPSDFGYNGGRPTHPELLDWLASEFQTNGWRLKPLHRLIMLSATYRQSGKLNEEFIRRDGQNLFLWRMPPRRLEAEAIRDSVLAVNGQLDPRMGGPGYNVWEKNTNYVVVFKPKADLGRQEFRRMVYQFKPRTQQDPTFGIFDCPDAALARPKRTASTTALQALNLLNSRFMLTQSGFFAQRLQREASDDPSRQVERAFLLAFGRRPNEKERSAAVALIREQGLVTFCRAIYNANEFLYVD